MFLITLTMSVYQTFVVNQSKVLGMMNLIPKGALQFKGISDFNDLMSSLGFYAVNNIIYMMVLGSIFAIVLASNILLKEEYGKTAEYLLTRPVTRSEVFYTKLSIILLYIFLLNLFTSLTGLACLEIFGTGSLDLLAFLTLSLYTFLLNLLFGSIGLFVSTLIKKPKPITTLCIGLVLVLYFIYTVSKLTQRYSWIGYISPFKYVRLEVTQTHYTLDGWRLAYFLGIAAVMTVGSFFLYGKKDIYT
jgi:ABC-2 type transport system permease protein